MRGADTFAEGLFTMRKVEDFVPARHPRRKTRAIANAALDKLGPTFTTRAGSTAGCCRTCGWFNR